MLVGEVAAEQLERSASHDPRGVSAALRVCFTCLMKSEKETFSQQLSLLVERISQQGGQNSHLQDGGTPICGEDPSSIWVGSH